MPELPEVETIRTTLSKKIIGLTIVGVTVKRPEIIPGFSPEEFSDKITGSEIIKLGRRGKYLLLYLTDAQVLVVHLRMTGQLVYAEPETELAKHTHAVFFLSNGQELRFTDMRRFGRLILTTLAGLSLVSGLKDLGLEPLDQEFTPNYLQRKLLNRRTRIKSLLLDQAFIAGLGNIYVDEALHRAGLNPKRPASTLSPEEITLLYHSIKAVIQEGIQNRGTTFKDYVDGEGRKGSFQELLRVYNRAGSPCPNCGTAIAKSKVSSRSSYFCPACQPE